MADFPEGSPPAGNRLPMSTPDITIAVDVMGGDFAPDAIMDGVAEALARLGDSCKLFLVGDQTRIRENLARLALSDGDERLEIVHADEIIGMDEHPVKAIREKRHSSITMSMDLVKQGRAQGVFSAGSTGAAVGAAFLKWRMLPGLARPGLATLLPKETGGHWVLMDSGATVDCTPTYLAQFAVMGDLYARHILKRQNPAIGLLSNGTEVGKGNRQTQDAFRLIREIPGLNFVGNIEGHDLFTEDLDVVICDGFVGNIVLKTSEQLARSLSRMIKDSIMSRLTWKMGGLLCKGAFAAIKQATDASEIGGVPLLGVNGCCIIGHGNSNGHAAANGILAVRDFIASRINEKIVAQVHESALDQLN
ncbi:MAG: phosphate acyltransferase PlsX [Victivallales bacterium]|nr:phosphate acyltransferase PlsX [Victivallales bacterium]